MEKGGFGATPPPIIVMLNLFQHLAKHIDGV
jgi:hypothetical protein